jgi:hypothetical protein
MTQLRIGILLAPLSILAAAAQLVATRWGLVGDLAGGLLCGLLVLAGMRVFALETEHLYLPPLAAAAASLLGLGFGIIGSGISYPHGAWAAPLFAALPPGILMLTIGLRGARCQLCHSRLRGLLFFSCPRCHLVACENCWQFERGRCTLCETNQVLLFPLDSAWWQEHFGLQARGGRCTLCLRTADWNVAQWACRGCGRSQCRACWDDNNGQCSRCGWTIPDLPAQVSEFIAAEVPRERPDKVPHAQRKENSHA